MPDDESQQITCATYTHARRHPMVIGQIGGWTPPFQLSITQIGVLLGTIFIEYQTWGLWLGHLPGPVGLLLAAAIPGLLTWAVRQGRIEGRSLPRTVVAWLSLMLMPRPGRAGGRPYRPARAAPLGRATVYVVRGDRAGGAR